MRSTNWFSQVWLPRAIVVPCGSMSTVLIRVEPSSMPRTAPPSVITSLPLGRIVMRAPRLVTVPCLHRMLALTP